ncbi:MAG: hypothetical protein H0V88_12685 [Pyrinomonadaceae bacterium]|nr:hypothetical protein [Pyrinomonadaceae bacterium]
MTVPNVTARAAADELQRNVYRNTLDKKAVRVFTLEGSRRFSFSEQL